MSTTTVSPLFKQLQENPLAPFIYTPEQTISYQMTCHWVSSLIQQLRQADIPPQARIGWIVDNPLHSVLLQLACLHGNWIYCAVSPHLRAQALQQAMQTIDADVMITSTALDNCATLTLDWQYQEADIILQPRCAFNQWVDMILTSGSSGEPKAVIHSWQNLYYSAIGSQARIQLSQGDCWLASLPLFHVGGQALIYRALLCGASIALSFDSLEKTLGRFPITHLSLVPTQLYRLLKQENFHSNVLHLKHILIGGGPCNETQLQATLNRGFIAYMSYGSSEMSSQVATRVVGQGQGAGTLLPYQEVKINTNHEVLLRGLTLSPGYFKAGKRVPLSDEQGWFHSGDCGDYIDNQLVIHGRLDQMFICGGENIQPEEIEMALLNHPQIIAATVVAIADEEYGKRPVAFIKSNDTLTRASLDDFLKPKLSAFKRPVYYFEQPKQAGLKVQRTQLIRWLNQLTDYSSVEIQ
ncbi:o-succinylbenzoate--CoA ligase [Celerinatantimonas diazotrophica]|uniref:2-succinylbenzoyl-CoA synthetase n=1 Tax=Celerinatantimonas diazotrophica TaxID=412034 RepID=A0A4R1J8G9_9GAMM|nr:o-succinylbenzoate--CoA ligase [Celerinatantimonas diazotrophica]TCK46634.1 2-succinylbenzoyl-CoA synthetase [Celerinatantimonas diazotrophica]CAG9295336.1 2-succinylbenzoate--CoA ligase [Celerinatantimonas diazotrophica]